MKEQTKICKQCGEVKTLDQFYQQEKKRLDGTEWIYYNPRCKTCVINNSNESQKANREDINKKRKNYFKEYFKNPERKVKHREIVSKRNKEGKLLEWQRENKDKVYFYNQKHRNHKISKEEWLRCKEYFNYSCAYCVLTEVEHKKTHGQQLHKEHVDCEGANDLSNCVPACKNCNSLKNISVFEDWYNQENEKFSEERLHKINRWLENDYKQFKRKIN
jgi:hypothetical protein